MDEVAKQAKVLADKMLTARELAKSEGLLAGISSRAAANVQKA